MVRKKKNNRFSFKGQPKTMEELFEKTGYKPSGFFRGQKVEGRVVEVFSKRLVLDLDSKSEGLVVGEEFEAARPYIKSLSPQDKIWADILVPESESGHTLLSLRQAAQDYVWDRLSKAFRKDEKVKVEVVAVTKGGLAVNVLGLEAFVPSSHLGRKVAKSPQAFVGETLETKILELDRASERIVLSEKAVSEQELLLRQRRVLKAIKKGDRFKGRVVGIVNFGAFVTIERDSVELDGLVHLSEISWGKTTNTEEVLKEGDEVEVVVVGKDEGRLALSIKQAGKDPWEEVSEKYKTDTRVKGKVTRIGEFGAFVEVEPQVEGLLRLASVPAGVLLEEGDSVECFVEGVDNKKRRLSLSMVLKEKPIGYK